jgi:hypothetical protein|tara:strand:- start:30464 stop:30856 length:393 start_codon:yes stop_codon:yes gene_type:complete
MASENPIASVSYQANADLSAKQYFLMKRHTTADQCAIVAATTDVPIGVLQNKPAAAGRAAEIVTLGKTKAEVAAATDIAIGDKLGPDANGRLVKVTADNALFCAIAEEAATSATGDIITVTMQSPAFIGA